MSVRLVARSRFPYANRALRPGDEFDASDKDAFILIGAGTAAPADPEVTTPAAAVAEEQPARRRKYRRRDIVAEGTEPRSRALRAEGDVG